MDSFVGVTIQKHATECHPRVSSTHHPRGHPLGATSAAAAGGRGRIGHVGFRGAAEVGAEVPGEGRDDSRGLFVLSPLVLPPPYLID